jgi:hypothetical protein
MSRISYDTKRIIPAPLVNIQKQYQKSGNGENIGKVYQITLTGTMVAYMGSPKSDGSFWTAGGYPPDEDITANSRLSAIQRKQEALRQLFSVEGKHLEIQALDGTTPVKCNPRVIDINFPDGIWYEVCPYTITLECDELYGLVAGGREDTFAQYISEANEEWSIETNEEHAESIGIAKTYVLSHTISAQGKRFYADTGTGALIKQPWEYAKDFAISKLGFDAQIALSSGILHIPSYYNGYNHSRNEQINKQGGGYSVTETWVLASGAATEAFSVSVSDNLDSPFKTVTIEGTVTGYDERNSTLGLVTSKWTNAESKYNTVKTLIPTRAQQLSSLTLNPNPMSQTEGFNPVQGTVTYSYEYNTRPTNFIAGAKSEVISIVDNIGGESYAAVFVLGRPHGPVVQDLGTKPINKRSLNIEAVFEPAFLYGEAAPDLATLFNTKPDVSDIISAASPINIASVITSPNTVFQEQPQENWNPKDGRYSYSCTWAFEILES